MNHEGKIAIVTGAGQGIGLEICRRLAKSGAKVILNDIDSHLAENAAQQIEKENGHCIAVGGDSSDESVIHGLVHTATSRFGKLDIAIANAGITLFGDFFTYPAERFFKV